MWWGDGRPGDREKSILLPPRALVCHHTHDHTHMQRLYDTPEPTTTAANAPTPTQSVNLPLFLSLLSFVRTLRDVLELCAARWMVSMVFFTLWSFSELRHHFLVFPCTHTLGTPRTHYQNNKGLSISLI